jgi:hypothetical protein
MFKQLKKLNDIIPRYLRVDRNLDEIKINQGLILSSLNTQKQSHRLSDYEFKIFSQWGEDGIIQFLISNIEIRNRTFIEFGVEDFFESNCRFLMMKDNWSGYVIDGSAKNINRLKSSYFYWRYNLQAKESFITRENIKSLLEESGFDNEPGILSVDIDGVDYHILAELDNWKPSILIVEFNGILGNSRPVTVPYDGAFYRSAKHYSNLYYGANLPAFMHIANIRGYALVGTNSVGSNAFFVRRDLLNDKVMETSLDQCTTTATFREGRSRNGSMIYLTDRARRDLILDMPLVDVATGEHLFVRDILIN